MDLQMHMDWHKGGFTISNRAWGTIEVKRASGVPESKVAIPAEWSVQIGRVECKGNGGKNIKIRIEVLETRDDKLSESLKKGSIRIRSNLVKLWVMDRIEKKSICSKKTTW